MENTQTPKESFRVHEGRFALASKIFVEHGFSVEILLQQLSKISRDTFLNEKVSWHITQKIIEPIKWNILANPSLDIEIAGTVAKTAVHFGIDGLVNGIIFQEDVTIIASEGFWDRFRRLEGKKQPKTQTGDHPIHTCLEGYKKPLELAIDAICREHISMSHSGD